MKKTKTETNIIRISAAWFITGLMEMGISLILENAPLCPCTETEVINAFLGIASILVALVLVGQRKMIAKQIDSWRK
jgi:hypothetical protein